MFKERFNLKAYVSTKSIDAIAAEDMDLINKFTRRKFTEDEVYIYPIILCDNEVDRDYEYFLKEDLDKLAELFIGKTFIQDHSWESSNQHSRIYKTEVIKVDGERVKSPIESNSQPYYQLKAWAYTVVKGNEDIIEKIDAGILKEVSVGFSIKDLSCNICKGSFYECSHWPGQTYEVNGSKKTCYLHMKEPQEAYEVSFVAVPAQPRAGVIKGVNLKELKKKKPNNTKHQKTVRSIFYAKLEKRGAISMDRLKNLINKAKEEKSDVIEIPIEDLEKDLNIYDDAIKKASKAEDKLKELEPKAKMGEAYVEDLKKECNRLGKMAEGDSFNEEIMKSVFDKCDVEELKAFKKQYEDKVDKLYPPKPQIKDLDDNDEVATPVDNSAFK